MRKRILSFILALSMAVSLFPAGALAQSPGSTAAPQAAAAPAANTDLVINEDGVPTGTSGNGWSYDSVVLKLTSGAFDFSGDVNNPKGAIISCAIEVGENASITGGHFRCKIVNNGTIAGGVFDSINSGESLTNGLTGKITGGIFRDDFKDAVENISGCYLLKATPLQDVYGFAYDSRNVSRSEDLDYLSVPAYVVPHADGTEVVSFREPSIGCDVNVNGTVVAQLDNWDGATAVTIDGNTYYKLNPGVVPTGATVTIQPHVSHDLEIDTTTGLPTKQNTDASWGWTYDGTTLKLIDGTFDFDTKTLNCAVEIASDVVVNGGVYKKAVTNNGTINNGRFYYINDYGSSKKLITTPTGNGKVTGIVYMSGQYDSSSISFRTLSVNTDSIYSVEISQINGASPYSTESEECRNFGVYPGTLVDLTIFGEVYNLNGDIVGTNGVQYVGDDKSHITFTMPDERSTVNLYSRIQVTGGTITGATYGSAPVGKTVTVTLDESAVPADQTFDKWTVSPEGSELKDENGNTVDLTKKSLTFRMPKTDGYGPGMTLTATYKTPTYDSPLVIENGKPKLDGVDKAGNLYKGDGWTYDETGDGTLTLTANPANESGWDFSGDTALECAVVVNADATIKNGTFNGAVTNKGSLNGGTFNGEVTNEANASIGNDATFTGTVTNNGTINGGVFEKEVTNEGTINSGIFVKGLTAGSKKADGGCFGTDTSLDPNFFYKVTVEGGSIKKVYGQTAEHKEYSVDWNGALYVRWNQSVKLTADLNIATIDDMAIGSEGAYDSMYFDANDKTTIAFTMQNKDVKLEKAYNTALVIDSEGKPDTNGVKQVGNLYVGDGWEYDGETLTLTENPTGETCWAFNTDTALTCAVKVNAGVILSNGTFDGEVTNDGTIELGTYKKKVTNNGKINNSAVFNGEVENTSTGTIEFGMFKGTVTNEGTIKDGIFEGKVTNHNAIENGTFTGAVINNGNVQYGVFAVADGQTAPEGAKKITLTDGSIEYVNDATVKYGATLYAMPGTKVTVRTNGVTFAKLNGKAIGVDNCNSSVDPNTGRLSFDMPENVDEVVLEKAAAPAPDPDQPQPGEPGKDDTKAAEYTIKVDEYAKVNGKDTVTVKAGETVSLTVSETPDGQTFDHWDLPSDLQEALTKQDSTFNNNVQNLSFRMPKMGDEDVTFSIKTGFRSAELPADDSAPSALGTAAIVAAGGATAGILVWQGVTLGVESYLQLNLPDGVPVPTNRRELVKLLWEEAGKPEVALPALYNDIPAEELELQKASRWAEESGLVKAADANDASRFDPDHYVTKMDVFGAWLKLKKLLKNP